MAARAGRSARARPHRRCVGCGRIAPKNELLRIALRDPSRRGGSAVLDRAGRMPGRGAYLCAGVDGVPVPACLDRALGRNAIARALRCNGTVTLVESMSR